MKEKPNLSYIDSLAEGDIKFKEKLIEIMQTEFPEEKAKYKRLIKEKSFKKTAELIHKIKHKISILGYEKGYLIAEKYEESLKTLSPDTILQAKFEELLKQIENFLAKL